MLKLATNVADLQGLTEGTLIFIIPSPERDLPDAATGIEGFFVSIGNKSLKIAPLCGDGKNISIPMSHVNACLRGETFTIEDIPVPGQVRISTVVIPRVVDPEPTFQ